MKGASRPLVMGFAVLDEDDVVEYFIEYHLSLGVDAFLCIDLGSIDGTLEKLAKYEQRGILHLERLESPDLLDRDDGSRWLQTAQRNFNPEWCIGADPDEFWVLPTDDFGEYLESSPSSIVIAPRYNALPEHTCDDNLKHFSDLSLLVRQPLEFSYDTELALRSAAPDNVEEARALLWKHPPEVLRRILPKFAARTSVMRSVVAGCHDVETQGERILRHHAEDAFVAHLPFRSLRQLERKARDVDRFVERHLRVCPDAPIAPHWLRLSALYRHHMLEAEFDRQILDDVTVARYLDDGTLVNDRQLSQRLKTLNVAVSSFSRSPTGTRSVGDSFH